MSLDIFGNSNRLALTRSSMGVWSETKPIDRVMEKKDPVATIVRSEYTIERPRDVTFKKLIEYHDATPQVQIAVSSYAELITGTEMNIQAKSDAAQKVLDEWCRGTNFYNKFEGLVTTILITGNGLLEKLDENETEDVSEVDMSTIIGKRRDEFGELQYYEHRTQFGAIDRLGEGRLGKFIEFNLTNYSKQAWGRSLFYSLAVPRSVGNRTTAPLVEIMWGVEDAMGAILLNNAFPITTITYSTANDEYLKKETRRWREYKPGDKRIQKQKPEIEFFEPSEGSGRYQFIVDHLEKTFELGTQFPHDIMTGDFTSRASSETTENIVMKRVRGYQKYLADKLKQELFDPILIQNGFDPDKEEIEITFSTQDVKELNVEQVLNLYKDKAISIKELRDWLKTNVGIDLFDDDEVLGAIQQARNMMAQADQNDDKQQQFQQQQEESIKLLESKIDRVKQENDWGQKQKDIEEKLNRKLELVKDAMAESKEKLYKTRIKALEKLIERADKIG